MDVAGSTVMITGAGGGLGEVIARDLASRGARLVLTGRRAEQVDDLAAELGGTAVAADLNRRDDVAVLAEWMTDVDCLVANAAVGRGPALVELDEPTINESFEVNLRAPVVLATRLIRDHLASGRPGSVVMIGALAGRAPTPQSHVYCAGKAGLRGFVLSTAQDLRDTNVGISIVEPATVRDRGMFHRGGSVLPPGTRTASPAQVAAGVRTAMRTGRPEIVVAPVEQRVLATFGAAAPSLLARLFGLVGGIGPTADSASGNDGTPATDRRSTDTSGG